MYTVWKVKEFTDLSIKEIKWWVAELVFQIIYKHWNLVDVFVELVRCHGNWYDVTSTL